jgi:hypothetical protein
MSLNDVRLVRLYIDEPSNDNFDDTVISDMLDRVDGDVYSAAAEFWRIKAGTVVDWYQVTADGSSLSRGQVFDHCQAMATYYSSQGTFAGAGTMASVRMSTDYLINDDESEDDLV